MMDCYLEVQTETVLSKLLVIKMYPSNRGKMTEGLSEEQCHFVALLAAEAIVKSVSKSARDRQSVEEC